MLLFRHPTRVLSERQVFGTRKRLYCSP